MYAAGDPAGVGGTNNNGGNGNESLATTMHDMGLNILLAPYDSAPGQNGWPSPFAMDNGQLVAMTQNNIYIIGGYQVSGSDDTDTDPHDVLSIKTLLANTPIDGSGSSFPNFLAYQLGDEPGDCQDAYNGTVWAQNVANYDATDPGPGNHGSAYNTAVAWMTTGPGTLGNMGVGGTGACTYPALLQSLLEASFDAYPVTSPGVYAEYISPGGTSSLTAADSLFMEGVFVEGMVYYTSPGWATGTLTGPSTKPIWAFWSDGGDDWTHITGQGTNFFTATLSKLGNGNYNYKSIHSATARFSSNWIGLDIRFTSNSGLITDFGVATAATPHDLTVPGPSPAPPDFDPTQGNFGAWGGDENGEDCISSINMCVVSGSEVRATDAQILSGAWMVFIEGGVGLELFGRDLSAETFALGGASYGSTWNALSVHVEGLLTQIYSDLQQYGNVINSMTLGICSMNTENWYNGVNSRAALTKKTSCSNGALALSTSVGAVPAIGLIKRYNGSRYILVESDRNGSTTLRVTSRGQAGHTATVIYDSDHIVDPPNSSVGSTFVLDSNGSLTDTFGANGDNYQVKIYEVN